MHTCVLHIRIFYVSEYFTYRIVAMLQGRHSSLAKVTSQGEGTLCHILSMIEGLGKYIYAHIGMLTPLCIIAPEYAHLETEQLIVPQQVFNAIQFTQPHYFFNLNQWVILEK